jgi:hypothetical protein
MAVACLPFSKTLKTTGTWVVGFERNDFFEGPRPPPAAIMWHSSSGAELIVDEKLFRPSDEIQAYQVDVIGKRAMCAMWVPNPYPIAVEKLIVRRRIGQMPS